MSRLSQLIDLDIGGNREDENKNDTNAPEWFYAG